jgi:hypothetical protein
MSDPKQHISPSLKNTGSKSGRGFHHPVLARLLLPIDWYTGDNELDTRYVAVLLPYPVTLNPPYLSTIEEINSGRKVPANLLPCFLWPEGHIFDPEDPEDGLFRGHIPVRVRCHAVCLWILLNTLQCAKMVYIGPASALTIPGAKRGKPGNAAVMQMRKMTVRALAYVAVQVRFFLCFKPWPFTRLFSRHGLRCRPQRNGEVDWTLQVSTMRPFFGL